MQKIIAIIFKFLKNTKKWKLNWKFEAYVLNGGPFSFDSNFQKHIFFGKYFSTSQIPAILFFFLSAHNMCKRQRSSGKFRLHKYLLYDERPVENTISFKWLQLDSNPEPLSS